MNFWVITVIFSVTFRTIKCWKWDVIFELVTTFSPKVRFVTYWVGYTHATPCTPCADPYASGHNGCWVAESGHSDIIEVVVGRSKTLTLLPYLSCYLFQFYFLDGVTDYIFLWMLMYSVTPRFWERLCIELWLHILLWKDFPLIKFFSYLSMF